MAASAHDPMTERAGHHWRALPRTGSWVRLQATKCWRLGAAVQRLIERNLTTDLDVDSARWGFAAETNRVGSVASRFHDHPGRLGQPERHERLDTRQEARVGNTSKRRRDFSDLGLSKEVAE